MEPPPKEADLLPLSLELSAHVDSDDEEGVSVEKQETHGGTIRLLVSLPRIVDAEQANLAVSLLFEQMEQLPVATSVERVKVAGLRFTPAGVNGIKEFLSVHAPTVKIASLKDILRDSVSPEEEAVFSALAQTFQDSKLEVLNLSDNTIGAYMWKNWANQTDLRHLLLDHVDMDDASIKELACQLTCGDTLEDIYAVLARPTGAVSVTDASSLLGSCKSIISLRWAHETADNESKLPWFGLQQMVRSQLEGGGVVALRHLVMDGSLITASELDGLHGALKEMSQLKTLKLRDIGLKDEGVKSVVGALQLSQPPLEWLDLSGNQIQGVGAKAIAKLVNVDSIISNIKMLLLESNEIDTEGGSHIIVAFAPKISIDFDIWLDGNPMNFSKLAMGMAWQAAKERDALRRWEQQAAVQSNELQQSLRTLVSEKSSIAVDLQLLRASYEKQKKENDLLVEAFSILGLKTQISEQKRLLDRVSRLEEVMGLDSQAERSFDESSQNQKSRRDVRSGYDSPTSATVPDELSTPSSRTSNPASMSGGERSPFIPLNLSEANESSNTEPSSQLKFRSSSCNALPQSPFQFGSTDPKTSIAQPIAVRSTSNKSPVAFQFGSQSCAAPEANNEVTTSSETTTCNFSFGTMSNNKSRRLPTARRRLFPQLKETGVPK